MSYLRAKGIIIKQVNFGEADKIVTILTSSKGKISAFAKNAKRTKSRLAASAQLMCYGDFILFKGRNMYNINSCEVIEPFYNIRNDIIKLTYSAHILDIINDIVQENLPASRILQLLLNSLYMLAKTDKSPELIARIFEFRFLTIIGYAPCVSNCSVCGKKSKGDYFFSFNKCGFVCEDEACRAEDKFAIEIMPGTAKAITHIVHSPARELFSFELSPEVLKELGRISKKYLTDRLERDYTKLDFLKSL
jgi:DNA repair protein RecO (recombination protein O)